MAGYLANCNIVSCNNHGSIAKAAFKYFYTVIFETCTLERNLIWYNDQCFVSFEVLAAVLLQIQVFWDVMLC
jgi:hypothetical protein